MQQKMNLPYNTNKMKNRQKAIKDLKKSLVSLASAHKKMLKITSKRN